MNGFGKRAIWRAGSLRMADRRKPGAGKGVPVRGENRRGAEEARSGRRAALVIAGTALLWVGATFIGASLGLSQRMLALFDLLALGGFLWAFWMIYNIWRTRQNNEGR